MNAEPIETQAVIVRETEQAQPVAVPEKPKTSQELRTVEVSEALQPAYLRAATLELTDAECTALQAQFPDEIVEIRPHDGLIFIPHIHIRKRLSQVFKPGQWTTICRRHWLEGNTMYAEYVMLIRGCFVGESVGGHPYQPNNPKVNYSDTLESTEGEAVRRIAGKKLNCGSQVWEPEYARQWCAKYSFRGNDGKFYKGTPTPANAPQSSGNAPRSDFKGPSRGAGAQNAPKAKSEPKEATEKTRGWAIKELGADLVGPNRKLVTDYLCACGLILPTEGVEEWPIARVPVSHAQIRDISLALAGFQTEGRAEYPKWGEPAPAVTREKIQDNSHKGVIDQVTSKDGKSAKGPWTRYGVKISGEWHSTFDKKLGEWCRKNQGLHITYFFTKTEKGSDLERVLEAEEANLPGMGEDDVFPTSDKPF